MLKAFLETGRIKPADADLTVTASEGTTRGLHAHLFHRSDGKQILFLWSKDGDPTVRVALRRPGRSAVRYDLAANGQNVTAFDGRTLSQISLRAGDVAIFQIDA